jgi:hypothetical protein
MGRIRPADLVDDGDGEPRRVHQQDVRGALVAASNGRTAQARLLGVTRAADDPLPQGTGKIAARH